MTSDRQAETQTELDRAEMALAAGRDEQALRHAESAVRLSPDDPRARLAAAAVLLKQREHRAAMQALDAHDHLDPPSRHRPDVLRLRIEALSGLGLNQLALRAAETLGEACPDDPEAQRVIATLAEALDDHDRAVAAWRRVIGLAPSYTAARRRLVALLAVDHPEEVIDLLAGLPDAGSRLTRARLCHRAQRLADAEAEYDALLHDHGGDTTLWLEAGRVAADTGCAGLAERRLRHAADPRGPVADDAMAALAVTQMRRSAFAAAGRTWWRLARTGGKKQGARAWAGLALCALIEKRQALLRRAERELSLHTSRAERRAMMAELWPQAAAAAAARSALHEPAPDRATRSALTTLMRTASHTLAHESRQHPDRADVQYHLAVCDQALGETAIARQALDRALTINPNYAAAQAFAAKMDREHRRAA